MYWVDEEASNQRIGNNYIWSLDQGLDHGLDQFHSYTELSHKKKTMFT